MSKQPRAWWIVASWELRRTLRRVDFIISVLLTPALVLGALAGTQWLEQRSRNQIHTIVVAGGRDLPKLHPVQGVRWVEVGAAEAERAALLRAVRERRYDGVLFVPADLATGGRPELIVRREVPRVQHRIAEFLSTEAREQRAAASGLDSAALARLDAKVELAVTPVDAQARGSRADRMVAIVIMFLVVTVTFVTGAYAIIGISAEKQARVTEVVVSAISAQAWMDGKILAYSVLGLITGFVWALSGVWVLMSTMQAVPSSINLTTAVTSVLYGTLGFALYVAFFAGVMATLKDFHSAAKLQGDLLIVPILPVFLLRPILESPEATFATVVSLIPLFSPTLMPMRIALGQVPTWQVVLGLLLLAGAVWGMRRVAGMAFRIGMLMYGKDVNLPEIIRLAKRG
jgi:ABC-2 type transport system permease protein